MANNRQKGFTLIEIMVIIGIIGLLTTLILANLDTSRKLAQDTAIKLQVQSLANVTELTRTITGSYSAHNLDNFSLISPGTCDEKVFAGPKALDYANLCRGIEEQIFHTGLVTPPGLYMSWGVDTDPDTNYSFMVLLNSGEWFCLGSSGQRYTGPYNLSAPGCRNNP